MSDLPAPVVGKEANEHLRLWAAALRQVLEQISGKPCPVECLADAPVGAAPETAADFHLLIAASGALRGEMNVRVPTDSLMALATFMLGEEQERHAATGAASPQGSTFPNSDESKSAEPNSDEQSSSQQSSNQQNPDHREAVEELFRQVAGRAATSLSSSRGEVQLRVESGPSPSWAVAATAWMVTPSEASPRLTLEWRLSAALAAELAAAARAGGTIASTHHEEPSPPPSAPGSPSASPVQIAPDKLDLFKDVELDVALRFGGRQMLLREILELGPGSVIELDHQIQEPVDLLLDGRTIARGEVVVVEGNYGLRVLDIATPRQ
jgi:flagellar motor switch protein FliN/FliY